MATVTTALLLGALLAPSTASPLPQGGSTVALVPPEPGDDVVFIQPDPQGEQKPRGYQYQQLNPYDGSYKFGYETEDGEFRVEQRLGSGQLRGFSGTRTADGVVDVFRYSYDGYGYKQEPYTSEQVPGYLRSAAGPEGLPQLIRTLQLFPEYFD